MAFVSGSIHGSAAVATATAALSPSAGSAMMTMQQPTTAVMVGAAAGDEYARAAAHGHNYSCSKMQLGMNFQRNLKSLIITLH